MADEMCEAAYDEVGAVLAAPGYEDADDAGNDDGAVDDIVLAAALNEEGVYFCDVLE